MISKKKIVVQFNEANFKLISKYLDKYDLPNLREIVTNFSLVNTSSEKEYKNLEPWIQWYSFYVNKDFNSHKTFHLGDCLKMNHQAFTEELVKSGVQVGFFGSMNLKPNPKYKIFIPDAWTEAESDNSLSSKVVWKSMRKIIDKNARLKLGLSDIFGLLLMIGIPRNFFDILSCFQSLKSFLTRSRSELASLFDYFFLNYSLRRIKKNNIEFSMVFLNGLAHVQHHYLLNSEFVEGQNPSWYSKNNDDFLNSLKIYDKAFKKILSMRKNYEIWFITGLTQEACKNPIIYWRIRDVKDLMRNYLNFKITVHKRMTRDFEVEVKNKNNINKVIHFLENAKIVNGYDSKENSIKAFGFINKVSDNSVFASFVYSGSEKDIMLKYNNETLKMKKNIDFVAVKNGIHNQEGWAFSSSKTDYQKSDIPIWNLSKLITT
tara:strand:+ start:324 stop:1619 length:1296 start_codon:yes stop_codon:yes gene_type:complete